MAAIKLVVGLGNPGAEYDDTRHNAGFWLVDRLASQSGAALRNERGFHARVGKGQLGGKPVWLCQPQTFMNRSGIAVSALATFYRIATDEILVVHDELDLMPGAAKLKFGGSSAGHNGLKDITARCGGPGFWRLRLGIGHPRTLELAQNVADFVLHKPSRADLGSIDEAIDRGLAVLPALLDGNPEQAMLKLHTN
ncbi:aminoacyl-tRNA hydrolase [soil metagenome]